MFKKIFICSVAILNLNACHADSKSSAAEIVSFEQAELLRSKAYYENGRKLKEKKYKSLIPIYEKLAKNGHSESQFILGDIYSRGLGGEQDLRKGFYWTKKAADHGNVEAMINTALNYSSGEGVELNENKAKEYYDTAARLDDSRGKFGLGVINIENGHYKEGMSLLEESADKNHVKAQFELGLIYCDGVIVEQDYQKCNKYWKMAADQGHGDAAFNYGINLQYGHGAQNIDEAIKYYIEASNRGEEKASYNLSVIYKDDEYKRFDIKKSEYYFDLAKKQGFGREQMIISFGE